MVVSQRAVQQYLGRPFDSYTWMKKLHRDQLLAELRRLPVPPVFKTEPWLHQLVCFYLGVTHREFLFLLDMGLGKTKIILDLLTQAIRERRARRGLVFVPRLINMGDWATAARVHSDLEPWLVDVSDREEKFERLVNPRGDFTCIDYAGLHLACSKKVPNKGKARKRAANHLEPDFTKLDKLRRVYDFLAPDESHKLGNTESLWFAMVDYLAGTAQFRYATTGTLFGRNFDSIWAQFAIIDRGETFGPDIGLFHEAFFTKQAGHFETKLVYNRDTARKLTQMLGHKSLRYDDWEVADLPALVVHKRLFDLPDEQLEHYERALAGLIGANGQLAQMDAQWFRMRQLTAGYLQWKDDLGPHEVVFGTNPKLRALEAMVLDELPGKKLVVSYEYTRTGQTIADMLKAAGVRFEWLYGGTRDPIACKKRFIEDPSVQVFLMNSEAGGTGVDGLQAVSNYLVFYESPSSPTPRKQVLKRLYRAGQKSRTFVVDFACRGTVDNGILRALADDLDLYAQVMTGRVDKGKLL